MSNRFAFCVMSAWDRPEPEPEPVPDTRPWRGQPMTWEEFEASLPEDLKPRKQPVYEVWGTPDPPKPEPTPEPEPTPAPPETEPAAPTPLAHSWTWTRSWLPNINRSLWTSNTPPGTPHFVSEVSHPTPKGTHQEAHAIHPTSPASHRTPQGVPPSSKCAHCTSKGTHRISQRPHQKERPPPTFAF